MALDRRICHYRRDLTFYFLFQRGDTRSLAVTAAGNAGGAMTRSLKRLTHDFIKEEKK